MLNKKTFIISDRVNVFLRRSWVSCFMLCSGFAHAFHRFSGLHVPFTLRCQDLLESQDVLRFQVSILMIYPEM
jgi:hypothetical protein